MLAEIMKKIQVFELAASELDQPISVTSRGTVATVRDIIAEKATKEVRAMFGIAAAAAGNHVLPIAELDSQSLRYVATEVLRKTDSQHRVAFGLYGSYTTQQLIDEVDDPKSVVGKQITEAVRLNGEFIESAITSGKARPQVESSAGRHFPELDF
jgi:hypothetical protein